MVKSETFHLNHYVGTMLAQGGDLWFDESKIVFSPTSAIDRALGATDVEINFGKIQGVEFKGDLTKFFLIKTDNKIHRFHGRQAEIAWESINKVLAVKGIKTLSCTQCSAKLEPVFVFCPYCGFRALEA